MSAATPFINQPPGLRGLRQEQAPVRFTQVIGMLPASALRTRAGSLLGTVIFKGQRVPVIDLRLTLLLGVNPAAAQICIFIAESPGRRRPLLFAGLVDSEADAHALINTSTH